MRGTGLMHQAFLEGAFEHARGPFPVEDSDEAGKVNSLFSVDK